MSLCTWIEERNPKPEGEALRAPGVPGPRGLAKPRPRACPEFLLSACVCNSMNPTPPTSRRDFLRHAGGGFGLIALASLLAEQRLLADAPTTPLAPRSTPPPARARRAIFLFMSGG